MRLAFILASIGFVATVGVAEYNIGSFVVAGGGGTMAGGAFTSTATIGQPIASAPAASMGGVFSCTSGFWASVNNCPADLDSDGQVDDSDFVIFLSAYNLLICLDPSMPGGCPADLNGDALVDDADFIVFLSAYNTLVCP